MMRRTAITAIVALVGGLIPATAAGAPSPHSELQGVTRVVGRATAATVVVLPRPVTVDRHNPAVRVSGTGPLAGLLLRQDARRPAELLALSVDPCSKPPCRDERLDSNWVWAPGKGSAREVTLPAGRYFLYLIAEGGRTEVELRLKGLGGETTIRPKDRARSDFGELDAGPVGDTAAPVYRATGTLELPRFGMAIAALEIDAASHVAGRYFSCLRPTVEPVPPEAFSLTCTGASSWTMVTHDASDARIRLLDVSLADAGFYAQTVGLQAVAVAENVSSFGFSLSYDGRDDGARWFSSGISYEPRP